MSDTMSTGLLKQSVQMVDQEHSITSTYNQDAPLNSHDRRVLDNTQLIRRENEDDDHTKAPSFHKGTSTTIRLNYDEDDEETNSIESVVSKTEVNESKPTYKGEQDAPITTRVLYDAVPTHIASHVVTASFLKGYGVAGGHAEDASVGLGLIGMYEQTETSEANLLLDQNRQYIIHLMGLLILLNFFLNRG